MFNSWKNDYNHVKLHVAIVLSAVAAATSLANLFFGGVSESTIFHALSKMEALKAGWVENWEKVQQLYSSEAFKAQQSQAIDQALQKMGWQWATEQQPTTTENNTQEWAIKSLSKEQITAMKSNAYIDGNKNSKFLIVEYTDPECPFCVRQFKDNTIKTVMESNKDIAHIVKVVQWVNHTNTEYKSLAILCAGESQGDKWYYTLFDEILGWTQGSFPSFTLVTNNQVDEFANKLGIKKSNLDSCMQWSKAKNLYAAYRQEALSLWASGTPGNIIINTETGKYIHLAGAYPASAFQDALSKLN